MANQFFSSLSLIGTGIVYFVIALTKKLPEWYIKMFLIIIGCLAVVLGVAIFAGVLQI